MLQVAGSVTPGDYESWYNTWLTIANRTYSTVPDPAQHPVSACDRLLAAASYFRAADFYLHKNPDDPRIDQVWEKQLECFDRALEVFEYKATRHMLKADGFEVPIIFYRAKGEGKKKTLVAASGYDGAQEECLHMGGLAALERGYNVSCAHNAGNRFYDADNDARSYPTKDPDNRACAGTRRKGSSTAGKKPSRP